jgi:hypothetical protein
VLLIKTSVFCWNNNCVITCICYKDPTSNSAAAQVSKTDIAIEITVLYFTCTMWYFNPEETALPGLPMS